MAWVALVDGRALVVRWMVDEEGRNVSVNAKLYLDVLKNVWQEVRGRAGQLQYWWQQDGATCHTTNAVLTFLHAKFKDRIISRRSAIEWPPYSLV
jgi:hypothetical protein